MATRPPVAPPEEPPKAERLLEAGMQLMREHFADAENNLGVGHLYLSPTKLAARAGMSKGMLYHIWGRNGAKPFDSYVAELARRSLTEVNQPDELRAAIDVVHAQGASFHDAVVALGDDELDSMVNHPERRLSFIQALSLTAYSGCQAIRDSLRSASSAYDDLAPFYSHTLAIYGRRLRTVNAAGRPLTNVDFARAISCLTEGFAAEALYDPDILEADIAWTVGLRDQPCSIYAISLLALVDGLTELVPDA
jgi:AcrR family transcriptional regulator